MWQSVLVKMRKAHNFNLTLIRKDWIQHLGALLVFSILTIISTYPVVMRLRTHIIGDGGDNVEYYSYLHIARDNIQQMKYPWAYSDVYRYPYGFDFGLGSDAKAFVLIGGALSTFLSIPVVFNLLVLLIFTVNGFVSYMFFRSLTNSFLLGVAGGIMYGFSYFVMTKGMAYINLMQVYGFPLLGIGVLRIIQQRMILTRDIIVIILALLAIAASSAFYFVLLISVVVIALPWLGIWLVINQLDFSISINRILLLGIIIAAFLIGTLLFFPMMKGFMEGKAKNFSPHQSYPWAFSLFTNDYYKPFLDTSVLLPRYIQNNESIDLDSGNYMGIVEILLFIGYVFSLRKSRRELFHHILFVSFILFLWLLSLGVGGRALILPLTYLKAIPPFSMVNSPNRLFVIYYLMVISGVLLYLREHKISRYFTIIVIILTLLERINMNYPTTGLDARGANNKYTQVLKKFSGEGVLILPLPRGHTSYYNLVPFYSGKKLIDGYFHRFADGPLQNIATDQQELSLFRCEEGYETPRYDLVRIDDVSNFDFILKYNTQTIVLSKDLFNRDYCYNVRRNIVAVMGNLSFEEANLSRDDYESSMAYWRKRADNQRIKKAYFDEDVYIFFYQ